MDFWYRPENPDSARNKGPSGETGNYVPLFPHKYFALSRMRRTT